MIMKKMHFLSFNKKKEVKLTLANHSMTSVSSNSSGSVLPNNIMESDRLVSQHYILRETFGNDTMAPMSFDKTTVLDIGCGSGTWTMEMASQYPDSEFIGIDHEPLFPQNIKPANCEFRVLDLLRNNQIEQLPFMDNSIDYIFQRDLNWGLMTEHWEPLMNEYRRILRPGGYIELVEADIETSHLSSIERSFMDELISGFHRYRMNPFMSRQLNGLLTQSGYTDIQEQTASIALGWKRTELSRVAVTQHLDLLKSLQPWLSDHITPHQYQDYLHQLPSLWFKHRSSIEWTRCIGRKEE
ncbi:S-adenosyl-L-methionine-dependent methyltransferase [Pilobolus umbonatus]|nr:S-adenosyl-L-methionine-dependent methyltransferase [Pilobolus umbonatus]